VHELADDHPPLKRGYGHRNPPSPRPCQHPQPACTSSKRAMSWEQQMPIPLEPRQICDQDTRLLQVGADSSGLCQGPKQNTSYQSSILNRKTYQRSQKIQLKSRRCIPRCGGATC
jgi:hypothetical protein